MPVSKMKLVSIIGHIDSLDAAIIACGKTGVSHPEDSLTFFSDTMDFTSLQEENPYSDPLSRLESAMTRIGGEPEPVDVDVDLHSEENREALIRYVDHFSKQITDITRKRALISMRVEDLSKNCEQFEHFIGLKIDLDAILSCTTIKVRFGRLPRESFEKLKLYDDNPYVLFFPGASDENYYWGVYFAPLDFADEVDRVFSGLYFERLRIPAAVGAPQAIVSHLQYEKRISQNELKDIDKQINAIWLEEKTECLRVYAQLRLLNYYFSARRFAAKYNDKFILTGWIPAREETKFSLSLDTVDAIEYCIEDAEQIRQHTPPVMLRNPWLFKPFEFFVEMFGLPRYNEIDPTIFIGLTYTILFGIMFGDLGQGLCLTVIGWLMWKFKKLAIGKILIPCGISAAFFGTVFGSVFGFEHVLDPVYKSLFGLHEKPIEVMNPSMTGSVLLASAGVGLILIIIAMMLNVYSSLKRKDIESALFGPNGIAGLLFYAFLVFGIVGQLYGIFSMNLPYILLLIVLPVLLIYFKEPLGKLAERDKDWKPESWGEYCVQSFFEIFEVLLSYLSNTMSFLRVGAFVLVHAGMMMAVFTIAGLTSGFSSILIIIAGNVIVMVMEAFLVAIQVMRLEFYEMFSRYYNGDGRPYHPLEPTANEKVFSNKA